MMHTKSRGPHHKYYSFITVRIPLCRLDITQELGRCVTLSPMQAMNQPQLLFFSHSTKGKANEDN